MSDAELRSATDDDARLLWQWRNEPVARETPILVLTAHTITDAEKARLNGHILGIVDKGDEGVAGLRRWLQRLAPPPESGAAA